MKFGKNKSTLALIATGVGGAAVAGFGLSLGRDIYKGTKRMALTCCYCSLSSFAPSSVAEVLSEDTTGASWAPSS